jgi:hypothetical protein
MANYVERGYEVFIPVDSVPRCDFIALKDSKCTKVQVKTAAKRTYRAKETTYTVGVLTTTRNGIKAPYSPDEVDEFFVVGNKMAWVIPNLLIYPRKTIMLESTEPNYVPRHGFEIKDWRVCL